MTGQSDYFQSLHDEGVRYADIPLTTRKRREGVLPDEKTLKALRNAVQTEFNSSDTSRQDWLLQVNNAYRDYDRTPYDPEMLPVADMQVLRRPLVRGRVDRGKDSMFTSLNLNPFATAEVDSGQPGDVAHHAGLALSEQLRNAGFGKVLSDLLKGVFVAGTGWLKSQALADDSGAVRLDVEYVDARALFLSPHNVRDAAQCNMMAHRYYETVSWVRDMALAGLFDMKAAKSVGATSSRDFNDEGSTDREANWLNESDASPSTESGVVELLECYLRYRPRDEMDNEDSPLKPTEMWRVTATRQGFIVLRAERWHDGFPFTAVRAIGSSSTVYGTGFPSILKDDQFASDMLWSTSVEADILSATPSFEVDELSPTGKMLKARAKAGGSIRIRPGDIFWRKGTGAAITQIVHNPNVVQVDARLNRLEQDANAATIPMEPMSSYRSATEHRIAQGGVSAKENVILDMLRTDFSQALHRCAVLYRRYVAEPYSPGVFKVQHGTETYMVTEEAWNALRWSPRGTTSQSDVQLLMSSTAEARQISKEYWGLLPQMQQAGGAPAVLSWWESNRMRLETIGIQEWKKLIGDSPERDPNLVRTDVSAIQAGMNMLGQQQPQGGDMATMDGLPGGMGDATRQSDGAPTNMPGGQPQGDALGMLH